MKKVYNRSEIFSRAWVIRRESAMKYGCTVNEIMFGICLRMAWAEAESVYADNNAVTVLNEWNTMPDVEKVNFIRRCVKRSALNDIGYSTEDHYNQFIEFPAFSAYGVELDEFVNESYIRVMNALSLEKLISANIKRSEQFRKPVTLVTVVYNAAHASLMAVYRSAYKHGKASVRTVKDEDGKVFSYVETMASSQHYNTENSAIIRAELNDFRKHTDDINNTILDGMIAGYTEREIASRVPVSNVAVHKRIVKIREQLRAVFAMIA